MKTCVFPQHVDLDCGPVTAVDLALFAAASGDHNPLHLDVDAARAAGFDRPLVHGMLIMAFAGRLFTSKIGAGSVRSLQTRFTGVAKLGDRISLSASLVRVEESMAYYELTGRTADGREILTGRSAVARAPNA